MLIWFPFILYGLLFKVKEETFHGWHMRNSRIKNDILNSCNLYFPCPFSSFHKMLIFSVTKLQGSSTMGYFVPKQIQLDPLHLHKNVAIVWSGCVTCSVMDWWSSCSLFVGLIWQDVSWDEHCKCSWYTLMVHLKENAELLLENCLSLV